MIKNAKIKDVNLSMADYGCLVLEMQLEGNGWGVVFGGRVLGHGYVGAEEFKGTSRGVEEIMRIMDVVGVSRFNDMKDRYVRVEVGDWGSSISKIGNIIENKWFDYIEFYGDEK